MLDRLSHRRDRTKERRWDLVAQELHDGACQYAIAAQATLDAFRRENAEAWSGDWTDFDMGLRFLEHAAEELRRLVCGLRPIQLAAGDLPTAIASLIREIREAGGPDVELYHDVQADRIPPRLELAAFRIVQESLANACRHSKSKGVLVGLTQDEGSLYIQVQDWGVGFNADGASPEHFGLDGIRRRVAAANGTVAVQSNPGEGTLITVELPLGEDAE